MSIVKKSNWQSRIDAFWQAVILRFLPDFIKPDHLTIIRVVLIPVIIWLIINNYFLWAILGFLIASVLDGLDGSLARQKKMTSKFGSIIDPMIDKLLYAGCLIALVFKYQHPYLLTFSLSVDLLVVVIALIIYFSGHKNKLLAADSLGKAKMFFQILALISILFCLAFPVEWLLNLSLIILFISILFQAVSYLNYLWRMIKK